MLVGGAIEQMLVTDSVPPFRLPAKAVALVRTVSRTPLFAQAIRDSHSSWAR